MRARRITFSALVALMAIAVGMVAFSPFRSSADTVASPLPISSIPVVPDVTGVPVPDPTPPTAPADPTPVADPPPAAPAPKATAPAPKVSYPAAPAPAPAAPAPSGEEIGGQAGYAQVNDFRAANGLPALDWFDATYPKAVGWSHHLADTGTLSHSSLSDGVPPGWSALGENVAYNSSLAGAFTALENSPAHRANLLDTRYTRVSIGVVLQDGKYWVTQEFYG
jgi:uncharacterized protein YkwD